MNYYVDAISMCIAIILSNIGARYVITDLDNKGWSAFFGQANMIYLYIFCMAYLGCHDIVISGTLSVLYGLII